MRVAIQVIDSATEESEFYPSVEVDEFTGPAIQRAYDAALVAEAKSLGDYFDPMPPHVVKSWVVHEMSGGCFASFILHCTEPDAYFGHIAVVGFARIHD